MSLKETYSVSPKTKKMRVSSLPFRAGNESFGLIHKTVTMCNYVFTSVEMYSSIPWLLNLTNQDNSHHVNVLSNNNAMKRMLMNSITHIRSYLELKLLYAHS